MKNSSIRLMSFAILSILLPCIYGCGGGGGGAEAFLGGFLGGGGGGGSAAAGGGSVFLASSGIESGGGASIAALHNPEPITMALFGSGMMAMAFYKKRRK